jgi:lipoprotein-anchoring transpeptidase ErfK/SrfK
MLRPAASLWRGAARSREARRVVNRDDNRRRALAGAVPLLALCLAVVACGGAVGQGSSASPTPVPPAARLSITPASGARDVLPSRPITVRVTHGKLVRVTVRTSGDAVSGTLNASATAWRSRGPLDVATRYRVHVTALDEAGRTVAATSTFRTFTPRQTFATEIFEGDNQTYGVGMPLILTFSHPISDHRAVERSLELWTSKRVVGAWYWDGESTLYFRPRDYWPAHTRVRLVARLDGVQGAPGLYGDHTLTQSFVIGRSLIAVANTQSHHARIYLGRHLFGDWPMSSGRPGDDTPDGTYLTIDKANPVDMIGPGYNIEVPWSVRFTWSGDFMHDAYWSVGEQGFTNVSHGCVNLSPADAQTYYQLAVPGDPVTVTGSPRAGTWDNGWTVWFLSWQKLVRGSALREAVVAGPKGSAFVAAASLRPSRAKAPLSAPRPKNAAAA